MARTRYRIFDADTHHHFPSGSTLAPYMHDAGRPQYYGGWNGVPNPRGAFRKDTVPPNGGLPASDPAFMAKDHLDRHEIEYCVLNPGSTLGLGGMPDVDFASNMASATNDWTIQEWFPVDTRFLGSIIVNPRDPQQAAAEIQRLGSNPRMVQVTVTSLPCLAGSRFLHPIYKACNEFGLPFNFHVGGGDVGVNPGSWPVGLPTVFSEYHVGMCIPAIYHVISMVMEGVFIQYPKIKLVLNEFGVAWLPFVTWRLDMEYRAGREDTPWLTTLPSEYIREFVRFSTQPLEEPKNRKDLVTLLSLMHGDEVLMFSSDYPHWDADSPDVVLKAFPDEWKQKIFFENARDVFRIDQRLGEAAKLGGATA